MGEISPHASRALKVSRKIMYEVEVEVEFAEYYHSSSPFEIAGLL